MDDRMSVDLLLLAYKSVVGPPANVNMHRRPHVTSGNETLSGSNTRMRE